MTGVPRIFDYDLLQRRRERYAGTAHQHDFLLARVAEDFAERLSVVRRDFQSGACLGAYHGVVARALRQLPNVAHMIDVEGAQSLLAQADGPRLASSSEALPFGPNTLDLVVSALQLHLINDLPGVMAQIRQALRPDGLVLVSLLGGETLKELRHAWLLAEAEVMGGASPRVAPFADLRDLGGLLQRAGFALPVADTDVVVVRYASPLALMQDLRMMAASNMLIERRRVPVTRRLLMRACEFYVDHYGEPDGRIPATFEIMTLTAWVPHDSQQKPLAPGSAKMRLSQALGVTEHGLGEQSGDEPAKIKRAPSED